MRKWHIIDVWIKIANSNPVKKHEFKKFGRAKKLFLGAGLGSPAPENLFVGAGETPTRPWKSIYRGGSGDHPPLQNDFQGQATPPPPHPPLQNHFQGRLTCPPLQIAIFSCEKQGLLRRPPLKIPFRPPLQTLSAVGVFCAACSKSVLYLANHLSGRVAPEIL